MYCASCACCVRMLGGLSIIKDLFLLTGLKWYMYKATSERSCTVSLAVCAKLWEKAKLSLFGRLDDSVTDRDEGFSVWVGISVVVGMAGGINVAKRIRVLLWVLELSSYQATCSVLRLRLIS